MKPFNFYQDETLKRTYLPAVPGYLLSCYLLPAEPGAQKASGKVNLNLSAPSTVHAMTLLSFSRLLWSGTRGWCSWVEGQQSSSHEYSV